MPRVDTFDSRKFCLPSQVPWRLVDENNLYHYLNALCPAQQMGIVESAEPVTCFTCVLTGPK